MRVFFIGFGQAGGKLVDMFLAQDRKLGSTSFRGIVINTARTDLMGIKNIPMEDRLLIGQTMVKGHGVGTDNVTGAKVAADEIDTIISAIDAGLGGGTGSGGSPVLCRHLKRIYREPVYAVGIIPAPEEGRLYSLNAARSLSTLVNEADNVIVFDNSAWKNDGESVKSAYERLNEEIVRRFGVLFRAGEVGKYGVGEMVVDSSEIINTLRGGGISSVGYAISEAIPVVKGGGKPSSKKDNNGGLLSSILGKKRQVRINLQRSLAWFGVQCWAVLRFPVTTQLQSVPLYWLRVHRVSLIGKVLRSLRAGLKKILQVLRFVVVIIRWTADMWRQLFCLQGRRLYDLVSGHILLCLMTGSIRSLNEVLYEKNHILFDCSSVLCCIGRYCKCLAE